MDITDPTSLRTLVASLCTLGALALGSCQAPLYPSEHELEDQPGRIDLGDDSLANLAEHFHKEVLRLRPEAGGYGVVLRHGTWNDPAGGNIQARQRSLAELRARVDRVPAAALEPHDKLAREALLHAVLRETERLSLRLDHWRFDSDTEPHTLAFAVAKELPVGTPMERFELFQSWADCGRTVDERIEKLRRSAELGRVAPKPVILRVVSELEEILSVAPVRSPFIDVAKGGGRWLEVAPRANIATLAAELYGDAREQGRLRRTNLHLQDGEHAARGTRILVPSEDDELSLEGRGRFLASALESVARDLYPAFVRYRKMLIEELLPLAPNNDASPLARSAEGRAFYERLLRFHTTLSGELSEPSRLHDLARAWSDATTQEIRFLARRILGTEDWDELRDRLEESGLAEEGEVVLRIQEALLRGRRATPLASASPTAILERIDDDRPWSEQFCQRDRLGNLRFAHDLPSWAAEAAAYGAGAPGATWFLTQRGPDRLGLDRLLPEAVVDGWGLNALRTAHDLGLYTSDWELLGALAMEASEAGKLLADVGLHWMGWSREQARIVLANATLFDARDIERTLDYVLADPGRHGAPAVGRIVYHGQKAGSTKAWAHRLASTRPDRLDTITREFRARKNAEALERQPIEAAAGALEPDAAD